MKPIGELVMQTYVGRLTYWAGRGFSPCTFIGIHEDRQELEQWAIGKWNEMMPHKKIETVDQLREIHKNNHSSWDVWEREPDKIQMAHILD